MESIGANVLVAALILLNWHFFRRSYWRIVHAAQPPPNISREKAVACDFVSAFESIFCAPAPFLSSLILARKPPLAMLYKVRRHRHTCIDALRNAISMLVTCLVPTYHVDAGQQVDVLHETRASSILANTRYALAASCITTMSTDYSNRRRLSSSNIGTLVVSVGLTNRNSVTFLLMTAAALRSFSLEAEYWVHDERRNITSVLYAATRQHGDHDLLLRQCACIGSNMLLKSYSQTFNDLVMGFDLSPGCSFAMTCCKRLFALQLRSRPLCDHRHHGHEDEMRRLLLWTSLCHFLGNCCNSNSPEGMRVGGLVQSEGFASWLKSTLPGFTRIIPADPMHLDQSGSNHASSTGRKQSQSGLLFTHSANTFEHYVSRTTHDGSEELSLTKTQRMPVRAVAQGSGSAYARRPSSGIRTDTFDSCQHGMRTLSLHSPPLVPSSAGSVPVEPQAAASLLKHALPATAAVVEAAICQLMRLISNFGELLPSILVTAPFDTDRLAAATAAAPPPSINGTELLCHHQLLPKLLDFFEAAIQYRSAALHAASLLLRMQGQSMLDADVALRIQAVLLSICRRYFPRIMRSELHEFVCIAPRCVPSVPSAMELHQLVGVAYEGVDEAIQQLIGGGAGARE